MSFNSVQIVHIELATTVVKAKNKLILNGFLFECHM